LEGHIHNGVYVVNAVEAFSLNHERFGQFGKSKMRLHGLKETNI